VLLIRFRASFRKLFGDFKSQWLIKQKFLTQIKKYKPGENKPTTKSTTIAPHNMLETRPQTELIRKVGSVKTEPSVVDENRCLSMMCSRDLEVYLCVLFRVCPFLCTLRLMDQRQNLLVAEGDMRLTESKHWMTNYF